MMRGKVPKAVVKRMIESGRYTITLHGGTQITDWTKLFEDANEVKGTGWPDGDDQPIQVADIPSSTEPPPPIKKVRLPPLEPAHLIFNGKKYTRRQLEHFGDALFAIAVRTMVYDQCGSDQRLYFNFAGQMLTNKNLGHGFIREGSEREIDVGTAFIEKGLEAAIQRAKEIIETTEAWKNLIKFTAKKEKPDEVA